jgi:hypothetical protein
VLDKWSISWREDVKKWKSLPERNMNTSRLVHQARSGLTKHLPRRDSFVVVSSPCMCSSTISHCRVKLLVDMVCYVLWHCGGDQVS